MSRPKLQPYPGLRAFERYESRIFFGRQQQVDDLLARLKQHHFLAVLGASGSGKSSLVKAGLLPGLEKGYMGEVGSRWAIAEMRPGDQPFVRLAEGLLADKVFAESWNTLTPRPPLPEVEGEKENTALILRPSTSGRGVGGESSLAAALRRGSRSLHEILTHAPLPAGTRLLLMVDQFEEMFRFREQEENQAAAFVALLLEACTHPDVYVVITMRSDFLGAAAEFHGLPEAINGGLYLTPRLSREQLRDAISLPAQLFGGAVEDALANHLLNEAGNDPDQLPLLQHALMRLWENDADKILTLAEYRGLRGLRGALNDHAQQAWQELDADGQAVAETMFRALTERSKDGQDIRRPLKVQALLDMTGVDLPTLTRIVDTFRQPGRNFLMPPPQVALTADTVLDISHESLIRQWQRLQAWVVAEGDKAAMYLRLLEAAQRHADGRGELWRGLDLAIALKWRNETRPTRKWSIRYASSIESFNLAVNFLQKGEIEEGSISYLQEAESLLKKIYREFVADGEKHKLDTFISIVNDAFDKLSATYPFPRIELYLVNSLSANYSLVDVIEVPFGMIRVCLVENINFDDVFQGVDIEKIKQQFFYVISACIAESKIETAKWHTFYIWHIRRFGFPPNSKTEWQNIAHLKGWDGSAGKNRGGLEDSVIGKPLNSLFTHNPSKLRQTVHVEDEFVINGRDDVNQFAPFKYPWAWEFFIEASKNHWTPLGINMSQDKYDYHNNLKQEERHVYENVLAYLSTSEILFTRRISLMVMEKMDAPELQIYLARQVYEAALHTWTYQHCIETIGLDQHAIYNRYRIVPEINSKIQITNRRLNDVLRADINIKNADDLRDFILSYIFFSGIVEGCWFYNGFSPIFVLQQSGLMKGTGEQLQYIMRDEVSHCSFGIRVIRQIMQEENVKLDPQTVRDMWDEAEAAEVDYSKFLLSTPILGYSEQDHNEQFRFIANRRARQLGMKEPFPGAKNTLLGLDEQSNIRKEKNFL